MTFYYICVTYMLHLCYACFTNYYTFTTPIKLLRSLRFLVKTYFKNLEIRT